jgi:uncharacterized membrane protein YccC
MLDNLIAKKAPRKSKAQLQTEIEALNGTLDSLREAEIALAKTDFAYEAEITAIGRLRTAFGNRTNQLQDFIAGQK